MDDIVYEYHRGNLPEFWKHQPYQCFAPRVIAIGSYSYMEIGFKYWPPYALPFIIWGSFLLLLLLFSCFMKCFKCLGYQHWTNWLVFMFAVNGSLWFWMIYYLFFQLSCIWKGHNYGGFLPGFFGYQGTGLYNSLYYFFSIIIIVIILLVITIYDLVTMEEQKIIQKWLSPEDASEYFMALKDSEPRQRVLVEVFHEEGHRPRYERIDMGEVVKGKVVTFTEDRDFDYDTWEDLTNYPDIEDLLEHHLFVTFRINVTIEPGDTTTQRILDSFKRRLVASCAYRDQRFSEKVEGILPAMKFTKIIVRRTENICGARHPMRSCFEAFCFSCCGFWLACLFSFGVIVRVLLRKEMRTISLNIKKKYFADPANVRTYDFEASQSEDQAIATMFDGAEGTSLLPGRTASRNPSPAPTAPPSTHDNTDHYQDIEMQPEYCDEKPPPSYEDALVL